jgi:NADH:ubiquinone oxidoreductase subunit 3 (subunit A)
MEKVSVAPSRTKTVSFVLATLLIALPAMILIYRWATGV